MTSPVDLAAVRARLAAARRRQLGFPVATDIDFGPVAWVQEGFVNNLGDPQVEGGRWPVHSKDVERAVITAFAELFGGQPGRSWGYVTAGGSSEAVLHGMWLGRRRFPDAHVYHSAAAHFSTATAAELLGLPVSVVGVDDADEIRYDQLARAVAAHRDRAALVVCTVGTTMTEAVDDIASVHEVLDEAGITRRHIVVDAALSGPALAATADPTAHLLAEHGHYPSRGRVDADAVCVSGHKSLGTPNVCAVALTRREHVASVGRAVDYLVDTALTVSGSRPGQTPVQLWHAWHTLGGVAGLARRAHAARELAEHTVQRLTALGWAAWRHPHAWTVVMQAPSEALCRRWALPQSGGRAHLICMPGVTRDDIDAFCAELTAELALAINIPSEEEHTA